MNGPDAQPGPSPSRLASRAPQDDWDRLECAATSFADSIFKQPLTPLSSPGSTGRPSITETSVLAPSFAGRYMGLMVLPAMRSIVRRRRFAPPHHEGLTSSHMSRPHPEEPRSGVSKDEPRRRCRDTRPHSRGAMRPSFATPSSPRKFRGRREDRVPAAPMAPAQKKIARGALTTGVAANTPAFPARVVLRLTSRSPR